MKLSNKLLTLKIAKEHLPHRQFETEETISIDLA